MQPSTVSPGPQIPAPSGGAGLTAEEADIRRYYESQGSVDPSTYISREMPQHTSLQDTVVGENYYEASNIRNTPRYVAGKRGEESALSRALDLDETTPAELRRPTEGYAYADPSYQSPYYDSASEAQQSAIISEGLENYQFSDFAEGMRSDPGAKRVPWSGGPGTDYTKTAAWESVGQTIPVSSPNLVQDIESMSEFNIASPDFVQPIGQSTRDLQRSLYWQEILFGK
jgi:hypothetical protein